jgi:hypothetical protein
MSNTDTLTTSQVQDLCFTEICDIMDAGWADWYVEFEYNGKQYTGILGACSHHPKMMHADTIEAIEEA